MKDKIRNIGSLIVDELRFDFLKSSFDNIDKSKRLLDLGCGHKPFYNLYENKVEYAIGTDVPFSPHGVESTDVFSNGIKLPFKDASIDIVLSSEVMEHIPEPNLFLQEIYRVLSPNGLLIMTTPFLVPEHEAPYDFYRYTRYGLEYLLTTSGFIINKIEPFGEILGVLLSNVIQIQMKFWNIFAKFLTLEILTTIYNPFVFCFVYSPQIVYVFLIRQLAKNKKWTKLYHRYSYTTKGFGLVATKNPEVNYLHRY